MRSSLNQNVKNVPPKNTGGPQGINRMLRLKWWASLFAIVFSVFLSEGFVSLFYDFPNGCVIANPNASFI